MLSFELLVQERLDYLEDGKNIFRLRLRLCSSLYPVNERIRDFFLEYDRHTLRTSPPWGSELLEVILVYFLFPSHFQLSGSLNLHDAVKSS